jgi:hypothetical protein
MQAKALLCPVCIDRGLKRHEKTGSALNVSAQNSPQIIHKMKGENRQMEYEFMTAATPLPLCMPFPKALAGLPVSSTAKVMYCKMLDAMLTKSWRMRTESCLYIFLSGSLLLNSPGVR